MKRFGQLYPAICSMDNLKTAFKQASRRKAHYREVKAFKKDVEKNCGIIRQMLVNKTFQNSDYELFISNQYGKVREIAKLPFYPDRVVQHALCQVLEPIWDRQYIRDTFSCIKGRGIHDGVQRIKEALKDEAGTQYCLKLDIKKFYPSIDNEILKQIVRRKIKCKDTLWLLDEIIDSTQGLPIGNYTSQHLGNIYLSRFDHFVKEDLKATYYYRYCDDMVLLSDSKKELHAWFCQIKTYLQEHLSLSIKPNWQVFPVDVRGIDFLGYRFFHGYTLLRKSLAQAFKKRMGEIKSHANPNASTSVRSSAASYAGWMKYANCYNLQQTYLPNGLPGL